MNRARVIEILGKYLSDKNDYNYTLYSLDTLMFDEYYIQREGSKNDFVISITDKDNNQTYWQAPCYYSSFESEFDIDWRKIYQVEPKTKTITIWERVN